jgi:hypothetical protein
MKEKTLESGEGEKRGLMLSKEEHNNVNNINQRETDRLDRLESILSALMGLQMGQGKASILTFLNFVKQN